VYGNSLVTILETTVIYPCYQVLIYSEGIYRSIERAERDTTLPLEGSQDPLDPPPGPDLKSGYRDS